MASNIFIQFTKPSGSGPAVRGSSEEAGHPHWVELQSFSWGVTRSTRVDASGERETATSQPTDIFMTTDDGAAFTGLFRGCGMGTNYGSVTIEAVRDGRAYMRLELEDVLISSCQVLGGRHDTAPTIRFSINARKIKATSLPQATDPAGPAAWPQQSPPPKKKP
ncbi:MAG: type VI secretion system tube protein Hcp [bacterium]